MKKLAKRMEHFKDFICFPHIRVCIGIIVIALLSVFISFYFEKNSFPFVASIFSNIFAGLVTGLIICLISGVKQISIYVLNCKLEWIKHLNEMLCEYNNLYRELLLKKQIEDTMEFFDFVYEVGCRANWVNDEILQSSFDKRLSFSPREYCKEQYGYDAYLLIDEFSELHENLTSLDLAILSKKEILDYFKVTNKELSSLMSRVSRDISEIEIKLATINRTIV